jgi:inhibitor of cysteine peptidase
MKKSSMSIVIALFTLTLLAACKPAGLTEVDNGRTIEISKGASLSITLQSNPSTGYAWTVATIDSTILQQQGDKVYQQGNTDPNVVGAGGTETFTFKGLTAAQTTLQLIYSRVWETDVAPLQTFEITIIVK